MNSFQSTTEQHFVEQFEIVKTYSTLWLSICDSNNALFEKVCAAKPLVNAEQHVLGILTKTHIESSALLEQQHGANKAMGAIISNSIGQDHASKFNNVYFDQLMLVTHVWLYFQGYLRMDFSLANDHAFQTATLLASINDKNPNTIRTAFMESYYLGKEANPVAQKTSLSDKIKHWFNW